jgi:hypothetical protein
MSKFSFRHARFLVNFHLMVIWSRFTRRFHALAWRRRIAISPILRFRRHWRLKRPISISAWLSQLPCLGGVDSKPLPQPSPVLFAEALHQRLASMGAQVIHDQMNGVGSGIVLGDAAQKIGKFGDERVGVTLVKSTPALGSMPQ